MTKNCGTCKWFEPYSFDDEGNGSCEWPADRLPYSLRWGNRERVSVQREEGKDCSCHEPKEKP